MAEVLPTMLQEAKSLKDESPPSITLCRLEGDMMDFGIQPPDFFDTGLTNSTTKVDKYVGVLWAGGEFL